MPTGISPFAGLAHLDEIIAELHRIPTVIYQIFIERIGRGIAKAPPQVFQDVHPQELALFIIHMLAEQAYGADAFQHSLLHPGDCNRGNQPLFSTPLLSPSVNACRLRMETQPFTSMEYLL